MGPDLRVIGEVRPACSFKVDVLPRLPNVKVAAGCIGSYTPRPGNGGQRGT